jgi:predicted TIM-barrel fold metal-dependent hydrolase
MSKAVSVIEETKNFSIAINTFEGNALEKRHRERKQTQAKNTREFIEDLRATDTLMLDVIRELEKRDIHTDRWGAEYFQALIYSSDLPKNDEFVTIGNNTKTFCEIAVAQIMAYAKSVDDRFTIKRFSINGRKEVWVRMYIDPRWKERTIGQYARGIFVRKSHRS